MYNRQLGESGYYDSGAMSMNRQRIYDLVRRIPAGQVATYGQIASWLHLSNPRQVGAALRALPEETDVPWHRVVNSKGEISDREGDGPRSQRRLLEEEGVQFEKGRIRLELYQWSGPLD